MRTLANILSAIARWFQTRQRAQQQLQLTARELGQERDAHRRQLEAARDAFLAYSLGLRQSKLLGDDDERREERVLQALTVRKR